MRKRGINHHLAPANYQGLNAVSPLFFSLNKLLFFFPVAVDGKQGARQKQRPAKYGPFFWLNSTDEPHCLEEFDFLPSPGSPCPSFGAPTAASGTLINDTQGEELKKLNSGSIQMVRGEGRSEPERGVKERMQNEGEGDMEGEVVGGS